MLQYRRPEPQPLVSARELWRPGKSSLLLDVYADTPVSAVGLTKEGLILAVVSELHSR